MDYQNGDYIKYQCDRVLKIVDSKKMQAVDIDGKPVDYSDACYPNILLDDKVLECCGFTRIDNVMELKINNLRFLFNCNTFKCEVYDYSSFTPIRECNLMVLSCLQDFVRNITGQELPVNHKTLAEIIREM